MKHLFGFLAAACVIAASYGLMASLQAQPNLDDIFIAEDTDGFDPGLPVGAQFPPIRALYQGREIASIDQFIGEKGAVFLANRSVDW